MKGRGCLWGLLAFLALGGGLRLAGLPERGLFYYDEGYMAQACKGPAIALRWAASAVWTGAPLDARDLRQEFVRSGFPYASFAARHGYGALSILGMSVAGIRDIIPLAINAVLGTATLAWAYRLGAILQGPRAGLLAAGFLALSPNHVFFSRSGLSHPTALFFALWAFCRCLARRSGDGKGVFGAGLLGGMALICHYSLFWVVPLLAIGEVSAAIRSGGNARAARARALLLIAGGAIPPFACEVGMRIARVALGEWIPGVGTYFSEAHYGLVELMGSVFSRARSTPWFYPIHTIRTEGMLFAVLLALAAGRELRRLWRAPDATLQPGTRLLALAVVAGYVVYTAVSFRACRTLLVIFPLGAVLIGCLLDRWAKTRNGIVVFLLLLHGAIVVPRLVRSIRCASPYPEIARAAQAEGRRLLAVDDFPVIDFYQPGGREVFVRDRAAFERIREAGPVWLAVINRGGRYGFDDPVWAAEGRYAFVRSVVETLRPVATYPAGFPLEFDFVDETFRADRLFSLDGVDYQIDVFSLEGFE